jgi:hypothetical protein
MAKRAGDSREKGGAMARLILLWAALLVTLASALAPQGLPSSRHIGSAFSPATTSVAIQARAMQPRAVAQRLVPPTMDPPVLLLALCCAFLLTFLAGCSQFYACATEALPAMRARNWRRARAPPA